MISKKNRFAQKLLSASISCAMVASLVSAPALSFAAESQDSGTEAAATAADDSTEGTERVNEDVKLEGAAPAAQAEAGTDVASAATEAAPADIDMVSARVDLAAAQTVVRYAGLNYAVDAESETAALVGCADLAFEGALDVPETIAVGGKSYTVTNISTNMNLGGGVRAQCALRVRASKL